MANQVHAEVTRSPSADSDSSDQAETETVESDRESRAVSLEEPVQREAGHVAAQAWKHVAGASLALEDIGDLERDQPFSCAAWIRLPANNATGSILARMDDQKGHRGWDLWLEGGRFGTHLINVWQDDALKVVTRDPLPGNQWNHVLMTYDGSSKASGVKLYVNGQLQPNNVAADTLKNSIRTEVPWKSVSDIRGRE
jgi:hypothetical protein